MPAGVYDYEAIAKARAVLNGEERTGRYFAPDDTGKLQDRSGGHEIDWATGACARCKASMGEQVEFAIYAKCPGSPLPAGTVLSQTRHLEFIADGRGGVFHKQLLPPGCQCPTCVPRPPLPRKITNAVPATLERHPYHPYQGGASLLEIKGLEVHGAPTTETPHPFGRIPVDAGFNGKYGALILAGTELLGEKGL